jgi:dTDP-4-dehydrorhamnose reductase
MASRHILIIGGHGKVAQFLTPLLLQRSWNVTSLIRTEEQTDAIRKLAAGEHLKGKLQVLVRSLADVKSAEQAKSILDEANADTIVWSAGRHPA